MEIVGFARFLNFDHLLLCESRQRYRNWTFSVLGRIVGVAISQWGPTERTIFNHLSPAASDTLRLFLETSMMYRLQHTVEINVVC